MQYIYHTKEGYYLKSELMTQTMFPRMYKRQAVSKEAGLFSYLFIYNTSFNVDHIAFLVLHLFILS